MILINRAASPVINQAKNTTRSILIVDDNDALASGLQASLEIEGYSVDVATDGRDGLECIALTAPDVVILDLILPQVSGFEILRHLRERGSSAAVIVLSARDQEVDKVQVLRLGADDYMVKPVGVLELIARVDAVFRRVRADSLHDMPYACRTEYRFGNVIVDRIRRTIHRGNREVDLRPMEFDLLLNLLDADGRVVSRQVLMENVWHYAPDIATRTVDQHINRLRKNLEDEPAARDTSSPSARLVTGSPCSVPRHRSHMLQCDLASNYSQAVMDIGTTSHLPNRSGILRELRVTREKSDTFGERLRQQQPVERILVNRR